MTPETCTTTATITSLEFAPDCEFEDTHNHGCNREAAQAVLVHACIADHHPADPETAEWVLLCQPHLDVLLDYVVRKFTGYSMCRCRLCGKMFESVAEVVIDWRKL